MELDPPIEGAVDFVNAVKRAGAFIVYLTGRDDSMRDGTLRSLKRSGFPVDQTSILITKPKFETPDIEFKQIAFSKISENGNVVAFFENEPANLNAMFDYFSADSIGVFLNTKHSGKIRAPYQNALWIKNY